MDPISIATRWSFLEALTDPCGVVSHGMEVLYLNAAARALVNPTWFGRRCWQVFPVREATCAARCPVVTAALQLGKILYCEEHLSPQGGAPITVGVAVIPLERASPNEERALLLFRLKEGESEEGFRQKLLEDAGQLHTAHLGSRPVQILQTRPDSTTSKSEPSARLRRLTKTH